MEHYKHTAATWNKVAELYEQKFMDLTLYNETYDFVCNSLSAEQKNILELGCGPGMIARYLLNKRPELQILGTDVAPNMVELAQKNNPNVKFRVMDCREINSLNQTFDALIVGFCIPYLNSNDTEKLFIDSFQILRENGLIYVSFVNGDESLSGPKTGSSGDSIYFYYHQTQTIRQKLESAGFKISRIFDVPFELPGNQTEIHTVICALK